LISDRHNQVEVRLAGANGKNTWSGVINIAGGPIAGRVTPTNFHLGPNENSDFQDIGPNQDAPKMLGVLLWDSAGKPKNGVAISPANRARFPKYDHLLVEVKNRDNMSNATSGNVIGGTILSTPPGAAGQKVSTRLARMANRSCQGRSCAARNFPEAQGGGQPNHGLLPIVFHSGDKLGQYQLKIEIIGGNSIQYTFHIL
jgi:hypothetical protein